jgi:hypothetical protein
LALFGLALVAGGSSGGGGGTVALAEVLAELPAIAGAAPGGAEASAAGRGGGALKGGLGAPAGITGPSATAPHAAAPVADGDGAEAEPMGGFEVGTTGCGERGSAAPSGRVPDPGAAPAVRAEGRSCVDSIGPSAGGVWWGVFGTTSRAVAPCQAPEACAASSAARCAWSGVEVGVAGCVPPRASDASAGGCQPAGSGMGCGGSCGCRSDGLAWSVIRLDGSPVAEV